MSHIERMRAEEEDLCEKINSLSTFIYENKAFKTLCPFEKVRMIKQLGFMTSYFHILKERIDSL